MSSLFTTEQLSILIEGELGTKPLSLTRMTFGHSSSEVYEIRLANQEFIIKVNPRFEVIETQVRNLSILSDMGLPVSKTVRVSSNTNTPSYVLFEKIPGRDLRYELSSMTRVQMSVLAEQLVGYQRRVMTLPKGRGFGWVGIGLEGNFPSWLGVIERELDKIKRLKEINLGRRILALADRFNPYLVRVEPVCHLDDVTTKNVIVHNGVLQGLVDFDVICYGDPMFWLALTRTAIFSDVGEVGMFYLEELQRLWGLNPIEQHVIQFYSLLHAASFAEFARINSDSSSQERLLNWLSANLAVLENQFKGFS